MKYLCIPLRGKYGGVALVSECARDLVNGYYWYGTPGGYATSFKVGLMHRRLMAAEPDEHVDHKNFNRLDNRYENLRTVTQAMNNTRVQKRQTPWPYKGVRFQFGKWRARIAGKHLGHFETAEDAARAYDAAAKKLFGHMAACNFGDQT